MTNNPGDGGMEWRGIDEFDTDALRDRQFLVWANSRAVNGSFSRGTITGNVRVWPAGWLGCDDMVTHFMIVDPPSSQAQTQGDGSLGTTSK